ncbi:MAG: hypothetical protein FWF27_00920 [Candidatus Bathyarchaeota archaeon]|nr:hypothetical protein [Candidatus Termiticorpusculum sp.]
MIREVSNYNVEYNHKLLLMQGFNLCEYEDLDYDTSETEHTYKQIINKLQNAKRYYNSNYQWLDERIYYNPYYDIVQTDVILVVEKTRKGFITFIYRKVKQ